MRWLKGALGPSKAEESVVPGLVWTRSGFLISTDPLRRDEAALAVNPFVALPFELALPPRWRHGLPADATSVARNGLADVAFAAHDLQSMDPNFGATVIVRVSEPVVEIDASLTEQESEFREGMASDASLRSSDLSRVVLPAGAALRCLFVTEEMQLQYYLHTPLASFAIWFTAPAEEMREREAEFDGMARSFRLRGGRDAQG